MKKVISILFALIMVFALTSNIALASNTITVTVNGQAVVFADQGPVMVDGRTLVPVAGVFQALGFTTQWHPDTRQVTVNRGTDVIVLTIGSRTFTTNSVSHTLDVPAQIIGSRTMLPIAIVLRSVGYEVNWDDATRTVSITSEAQPITPPFTVEESYRYGARPTVPWFLFEEGQYRYYLSAGFGIMLTFADGQRISLGNALEQQKVTNHDLVTALIANGLNVFTVSLEFKAVSQSLAGVWGWPDGGGNPIYIYSDGTWRHSSGDVGVYGNINITESGSGNFSLVFIVAHAEGPGAYGSPGIPPGYGVRYGDIWWDSVVYSPAVDELVFENWDGSMILMERNGE